jgi:hypothetical protein
MSERSDQLTNDAITQFLRSRSADPGLGLLDDIVRAVGATPQDRPWLGLQPIRLPRRTLLIVASALLLATMGAIAVGSRFLQPDPLLSAFGGTWVSTSDADGGTQTMSVRVSADGAVDITVHDTIASVCSGTPSTMTGTGAIEGGTRLVIPAPVYACDDGSQPQALSGPPLEEQLRNWTLALDPQTGTLSDGAGGVWYREGAAVPSPDSSSGPTISGQMWPQTSLEEVREAQELADAGDPDYTWQVDPVLASFGGPDAIGEPLEAEMFERFIREELGWEAFSGFGVQGYVEGGGHLEGVLFIRCAPGQTNPLYPEVYPEMPPEVRGCAPTIGDSRYETVRFNVDQPARRGPSGIWVVTGWEMLQPAERGSLALDEHLYPEFDQRPVEQAAPPSDAEVTALLESFLGARVDGERAEMYLHHHDAEGPSSPDEEVPLLYATTGGNPYERSEIERVQGPVWPTGWMEFKVRLFAEDGTVVEQSLAVVRQEDGRLGLVYGFPQTDEFPTTENGQAVPVPYSALDGEVTFDAAPPWSYTSHDRTSTTLGGVGRGSASQFTMFTVVADPLTGAGCEAGPAPADAEALVRSIRSNPDLEATDPVAVSVGGIDALLMDIVAPGQLEVGDCFVLEHLWLGQDGRMRLYLLDLPDGMSARILAIAISALDSEFEHVVEAATPVLDSFEFHTP